MVRYPCELLFLCGKRREDPNVPERTFASCVPISENCAHFDPKILIGRLQGLRSKETAGFAHEDQRKIISRARLQRSPGSPRLPVRGTNSPFIRLAATDAEDALCVASS